MTRNPNIKPGWKMTTAQHAYYWKNWSLVKAKLDLEDADRQQLHERAGLGPISAKAIDHLKEFDAIKGCFLAILEPDNLEAQLRQEYMPKERLLTRIQSMAPEAYTAVILRDRFGGKPLADLTESQLTQLRNTLAVRVANFPPVGRAERPF